MARPFKKLSVTPEMRRKWLQRHDGGESPPQIARGEGYDVRTVRKQLELARQERESRETRSLVLRDAMEAHYADLCKRAAQIESALNRNSLETIAMTDRICVALREHLPRALLWKYLKQWNDLKEAAQRLRSDIKTKLDKQISSNSKLAGAFSGGTIHTESLVGAMMHQVDMWSLGIAGLNVQENLRTEPVEEGQVVFRYGAWSVGTGAAEQLVGVRDAIARIERKIAKLDELQELTEKLKQIALMIPDIQEEVATITLKRVVPGRCKYCPI